MVLRRARDTKRPRGRPRQNRQLWRCVVRLPKVMAVQLTQAAKANGVSVNAAIEALVGAWLVSATSGAVQPSTTGDAAPVDGAQG